ncbi:MAG: hypothetical protein IT515_14940 [Burkholderiales bacterium]|nr:hypothetical protein [Burkholderiales bacterium]
MPIPPAALLRRLESTRLDYGSGRAAEKLRLLARLDRARLRTAQQVLRLHEHLAFMRAYPDDRAVLARVERMLRRFVRRGDLRRYRGALADSGIAGTAIRYAFFWPTARWLATRWPARLSIDWTNFDAPERLASALPLLVTPVEAIWLRLGDTTPRRALDRLRGKRTPDGTFYVRRVAAMPGDDFTRESYFDALDVPLVLQPGDDTPSRTHARHASSPVVFRTRPPERARPDLARELARPPRAVRRVPPREARELIDLGRAAMATRARDLDAFAYGSARDVRVVDDGDGLAWAIIGVVPERRPVLRSVYGIVTLRNGVPIGYLDIHVLFGCADLAYNTFASFRGAEAAHVLARLLAALRHLFAATSFTLAPYQLGRDNEEAIDSGAWWFYYKLGFRPRAAAIRAIARAELARMTANPRHRSSPRTLARLAEDYLYFETAGARAPHWPSLDTLGERVAARLAARAGADRESAVRECVRAAMRLLEAGRVRGAGERTTWSRWAPIVAALPGITRWSAFDRRALARVIAAKAGPSEDEYLARFDAHPRLDGALRRLTGS